MRRLLSRVFMLGFLALAVSCCMVPSVSSAEDVLVFSEEDDGHKYDFYLSTEEVSLWDTIPSYSCVVKLFHDGQYKHSETLGFESAKTLGLRMQTI